MKKQIQKLLLPLVLTITSLGLHAHAIQDSSFTGHVIADQMVLLKNQTSENKVILYVVAEGSKVQKGDLLVEFDTAKLKEQLGLAKINFDLAKAQLISAENESTLARVKVESSKKQFESELELLNVELEMLFARNGKFAVEQETLESTTIVENARTTFLKKKMELYEKEGQKENVGYLELKFQLADSQAKSRVAMKSLAFLKEVAMKQERKKIEIQKENVKLNLIESIHQAEADLNSVKSNVAAKKESLALETETLEHVRDEIKKCKIYAPQDGFAYYFPAGRSRTNFMVEEGAIVRPYQGIVYLPNLSSLSAEIMVAESKIGKLKKGQPAVLASDIDETKFEGAIKTISPYPDSDSWIRNGKKLYKVLVSIKKPGNLKIGQSVVVTIPN